MLMKNEARLNYKDTYSLKYLMRQLNVLDRRAQRYDRLLKDIRLGIYEIFWRLMEANIKK